MLWHEVRIPALYLATIHQKGSLGSAMDDLPTSPFGRKRHRDGEDWLPQGEQRADKVDYTLAIL